MVLILGLRASVLTLSCCLRSYYVCTTSQADICQLGMDQRKVNMLAREYCDDIKRKLKPVILSHRCNHSISVVLSSTLRAELRGFRGRGLAKCSIYKPDDRFTVQDDAGTARGSRKDEQE